MKKPIRQEDFLREENYHFDICYTSVLKRAIHTAYTVLDELDLAWIPIGKRLSFE